MTTTRLQKRRLTAIYSVPKRTRQVTQDSQQGAPQKQAAAKQISDDDHDGEHDCHLDEEDVIFMERLCQLDPSKLVQCAKGSANLLVQLESLSEGIRTNLERVKEERAKKKEEKRCKDRSLLFDSNTCFECRKPTNLLSPCLCFKQNGVDGHGVQVCKDCLAGKETMHSCCECSVALCETSCNKRVCNTCDAYFCSHCVENHESLSGWDTCGTCTEIYCSECKSEELMEGCGCAGKETSCKSCQGWLATCQCGNKVCSDCKKEPACGKDVVLCEGCAFSYECEGCECCARFKQRLRSRRFPYHISMNALLAVVDETSELNEHG